MPAGPRCRRLLKIEGVGPLGATALAAAIGHGHEFNNGRHFSAYLGLVPGHTNTGAKTVMRGITKRGNRYLRTLLIHGGRSAVYAARRHTNSRAVWLNRLREAKGHNVAAVALANKNARVAWAMLRYGEDYCPPRAHRQAPRRRAHRLASEQMLAGAVQSAHPGRQSREHFFVPPSAQTKGGTKKSFRQRT